MKFTFGSDPEFILMDQKGKFKSAIGVVEGTKKKRLRIGNNQFFYDNVLAECTVAPAESKDAAIENMGKVLKTYASVVRPLRLTNISAANFEKRELLHEDARKAGCEAEFCAYRMKNVSAAGVNKFFEKSGFRTAGGHVHLGTGLGHSHENCIMLVRMLDLFLGTSSLLIDRRPSSIERRKIYGRAGRYRQPKHGAEYRTLGNFWVSSPRLVALVYDICQRVVHLTEDRVHEEFWAVDRERLDSDDFWNSGGDPADCHRCKAYDANVLRKMFQMDREKAIKRGSSIIEFAFKFLPDKIKNKICELGSKRFDMYKEWGI